MVKTRKGDLKKQSQFLNEQFCVKSYAKGCYDNKSACGARKNKAKQSQFSYFAVAKEAEHALYSENSNSLRIRGAKMSENDKFYVERCLDGHPDDYRYLVRRYQGVLLANLAGKLGSRDRAEEAAQEALVRAYFNIGKLKKPDSFFSWLLGIADNVAKEQQRKEQLQRQREIVRSFTEESASTELSQDYALETAIAELPEVYRKIILLRYYGQHSCNQIAEQLDMPLGTVTKTLSRAYAMLRESLQQQKQSEVYEVSQ
jgi:RNA polymerase sigma-70 factor (ECF subfamily)